MAVLATLIMFVLGSIVFLIANKLVTMEREANEFLRYNKTALCERLGAFNVSFEYNFYLNQYAFESKDPLNRRKTKTLNAVQTKRLLQSAICNGNIDLNKLFNKSVTIKGI